jgi:hypothetical protein
MVRIQFSTDRARIQGNYLLATQSVVRRLRGQIFEVSRAALKLLDDHQISYEIIPIPEPSGSDSPRGPAGAPPVGSGEARG